MVLRATVSMDKASVAPSAAGLNYGHRGGNYKLRTSVRFEEKHDAGDDQDDDDDGSGKDEEAPATCVREP